MHDKPILIEGRAWEANSYVIGNILIDAGVSEDKIEPYKKDIDKIILTHGHFDHFAHIDKISDLCGAEIFIGEYDMNFLKDSGLSLSSHFLKENPDVHALPLKDGDTVNDFKVYHTPGHTRGSICLFSEYSGVLISGDTIFSGGSFGRTDLPTGSYTDMVNSINRLSELKIDSIWPGHGMPAAENAVRDVLLSKYEVQRHG